MCTCKFVMPGMPMNLNNCKVHKKQYACDDCQVCLSYKPTQRPRDQNNGGWPPCSCGHAAVAHNS